VGAEVSGATLLGGRRGLLSVVRVYQTPEALEVDEAEGYDVARRSVLLDEVLLVTYHRCYGWPLLVGMVVLVTIAGLLGALLAIGSPRTGLLTLAIGGLPWLVLAALRLALRLDVVTVYGVRSKATMEYWFRKRRAREVFGLVCRLARERQQQLKRPSRAAPPSATPPPLPT
jgi:hypothetical protein